MTASPPGAIRQIDLRWTDLIECEWVNSLERRMARRPDPSAKTAALMRKSIPGYDVPGYDAHLHRVPNSNPKDRHVAAAAVGCAPSILVTWNLRDFDAAELAAFDVELTQPDEFLVKLFQGAPDRVHASVEKAYGFVAQGHRRRDQSVPSWSDYLDVLATREATARSAGPRSIRS